MLNETIDIPSLLIKHNLLTDKDIAFFNKVLKESSPLRILIALQETYLYNIFGEHYRHAYYTFSGESNIPEVLEKLTIFYTNLKNAGLLSNKAIQHFGTDIKQYKQDFLFLNALTRYEYILDELSAPKLLPHIDKWYVNNVLSEESYKRLKADIEGGVIESYFQLIGYCRNARGIDLAGYSTNPDIYLEQIHKDVAEILSELAFTHFTFEEVEDLKLKDSNSTFYDFIISFKCNGKKYKQRSFSRLDGLKAKENNCHIDIQEFYQIFNKILAENQSTYRLHLIKIDKDETFGRRFGIVALKKEQAEAMRTSYNYISLSYENFKNKITSKSMQNVIEEWGKLGLLAHLSDVQIEEAVNSIKESRPNDYNDMLLMFPNVIYAIDTELGNLNNPYEELLLELSSISHGAFKPINITDTFENPVNGKVNVEFELNGKKYSKALTYDNDWIDTDVIDMIDAAVAENNLSGRFYNLPGDGQVAHFIYLEPAIKDILAEKKLLNFEFEFE